VIKARKIFVGLAVMVAFLLGVASTVAVMQYSQKISNVATLKLVGVGVYKDVNFTIPVTMIDWGMVEPGETKDYAVFLRSESNVPMSLTMYVANWNPANASNYLHLTWNYSGVQLAPHASLPIRFSLIVNASIPKFPAFSFDIWIVGSG
jgi:hypothetical protein